MKKHALISLLTLIIASLALPMNTHAQAGNDTIYAWYRADTGLRLDGSGPLISSWENDAGNRRHLVTRKQPIAVRVDTPSGPATVARFDGSSILCLNNRSWGTLGGNRTIIVYARLSNTAVGFLFDGFMKSGDTTGGLNRAQLQNGKWHTGAQLPPATDNANNADQPTLAADAGIWQAHAFVFTPSPPDKTRRGSGKLSVRHFILDAKGLRSATVEASADTPLAGFAIGANGLAKRGLKGDVAELLVISRAVGEEEFAKIAGVLRSRWGEPADSNEQIETGPKVSGLYRTVLRKRGDEGVAGYRIPALATTPKGTVIAVFDARNDTGGDLPADIDVAMMRSTDNGTTWSPMKRILDFEKNVPGSKSNGVGDPSILVDENNGTIFVAALWSQGDHAWHNSGPGLLPEETGQLVLTKSTDDGLTWSKPINITRQVKKPEWRLCLQGPGRGIQLRDGTLVFPAQYREAGPDGHPRSCFIWSADHGETWEISAPAVPGDIASSESQIAQLADGSLLLSLRAEIKKSDRQRLWARYDWSGNLRNGKWSKPWFDLPDPTCQASLMAHPTGPLLFANPASPDSRVDMTVRASMDGGRTWNAGRLIAPRPSAYSCMTVLKDGSIGILYETGAKFRYERLEFARFPLEWITSAPPRTWNPEPKNTK